MSPFSTFENLKNSAYLIWSLSFIISKLEALILCITGMLVKFQREKPKLPEVMKKNKVVSNNFSNV